MLSNIANRLLKLRKLSIVSRYCTVVEPEAPALTRKERIVNYFKNIVQDYKDVAVETGQDMKARPIKSTIYISLITTTLALFKTNPSEQELHDRLAECSTELMLLSERIRNPKSESGINQYLTYANSGRLRCYNIGFCSLVCLKGHAKEVSLYSAQCKYTEPHWTKFFTTVYDVGLFGRYINLEKCMKDFDINPEEWEENGQPNKKFKFYRDNNISWDMKLK